MLTHDYLCLRLNRLQKMEEWPNTRDGLAFIFPSAGTGQYASGSSANHFGPGDVLVLNSSSGGKVGVADGSEIVFWSFFAHLEQLFPLFADDEICLIQDLDDCFKNATCYAASSPVAAECHKLVAGVPTQFNLEHRSYLLRLVAVILSAELSRKRPVKVGFVRMEQHLTSVFDCLSIDEILSLSVGELAGRFSCSRRHLNRLFHHHFGCSVASLRMELRLLKAATLLRNPDAKASSVAEQCGFNHLGLFNSCFKRRFYVSPGQWRKKPIEAECQSNGLMSTHPQCRLLVQGLCPWCSDTGSGRSLHPTRVAPQKLEDPDQAVVAKRNNGKAGKSEGNDRKSTVVNVGNRSSVIGRQ